MGNLTALRAVGTFSRLRRNCQPRLAFAANVGFKSIAACHAAGGVHQHCLNARRAAPRKYRFGRSRLAQVSYASPKFGGLDGQPYSAARPWLRAGHIPVLGSRLSIDCGFLKEVGDV
jgi:hypothetical protein